MDRSTRQIIIGFTLAFICAQAGLYAVGCASGGMRSVNVPAGEYYTEAEYEALSNRAKTNYCNQLQNELAASEAELDGVVRDIEMTKDAIKSTRRSIVPIERKVLRLESDIRSLEDEIAEVKALPTEWRIRPGETLTIISMQKNVYNDIDKWWRILDANRVKIDDPYYIFPDTVLVIPRDWPLEGEPEIPEDLKEYVIVDEWEY
jgi:nucleoid-associated protein YgaU